MKTCGHPLLRYLNRRNRQNRRIFPWLHRPNDLNVSVVLQNIGTTDGTNREQLLAGSLAIFVRNHIKEGTGTVSWEEVLKAIKKAFLEDEDEFLRDVVEKCFQQPLEDTREYGQRYREAVRKAYSTADMEVALVKERLIKTFVKGLRDSGVHMQVH